MRKAVVVALLSAWSGMQVAVWAAFAGLPVGWGKLVRRGLSPRPG